MEDLQLIQEMFPEAIENNEINFKSLAIILAKEVNDLQDELNEKDYQILYIMNELDALKKH